MNNNYANQILSTVPFDALYLGMEVIGAHGEQGKLGSKVMPPFESDGFLRIDWVSFGSVSKFQSEFNDVTIKHVHVDPAPVQRRLALKAKYFTFTPIARGAVVHLTLYEPCWATADGIAKLDTQEIITTLLLRQENCADEDEPHEGPYEFMTAFRDPKNGDEVLHVLFKHLDLFDAVEGEEL